MRSEVFTAETGSLFADRYRIERLLGTGGMGAVYLAADALLDNEQIALKILHSELIADERHTKRFLREVKLTRKVTHPNVVRTFDVDTWNDKLFFTMEYVEGTTLKEKLGEEPIAYEEVCDILIEICKGLEAIHAAGIIHRDLKPGNVMITPDNHVRIADFGVARPNHSDLTAQDEVIGSAIYMAPEAWIGEEVTSATDIYALGVIAYKMLTGIAPFDGNSSAELMFKHLEVEPLPPRHTVETLPAWVDALILEMLAKKQEVRLGSAARVADLIELNREWNEDEYGLELDQQVELSQSQTCPEYLDLDSGAVLKPTEPQQQNSGEYTLADQPIVEQMAKAQSDTAIDPIHTWHRIGGKHVNEVTNSSLATEKGLTATKRLLKIPLLLTVVGAVAYLLFVPFSSGIDLLWDTIVHNAEIKQANGIVLALAPLLFFYALVAALPVLGLALFQRTLQESFSAWFKMSVLTGSLLLFLFLFFTTTLGYEWHQAFGDLKPARLFKVIDTTAQKTTKNLLETALLSTQGTFNQLKAVRGVPVLLESPQAALHTRLPYYLAFAGYILLLGSVIIHNILKIKKTRLSTLTLFTASLTTLCALETYFQSSLAKLTGWSTLNGLSYPLGPFTFEFSEYALGCAVVNWLVVFVGVGAKKYWLFQSDSP